MRGISDTGTMVPAGCCAGRGLEVSAITKAGRHVAIQRGAQALMVAWVTSLALGPAAIGAIIGRSMPEAR